MTLRILATGLLVLTLSACDKADQEKKSGGVDSTLTEAELGGQKAFASMSSEEKEALKESLMKQGKYDCCMKPGCTLCIGNKGECTCYLDIKRKDPICGECFEGYTAGRGKLKLMSIVELEQIRKQRGVK